MTTAASRDRLLFGAAIVVGAAGWAWAGGREAWDSPLYWSLVLPLTYAFVFLFGTFGSRSAWRWPALVFGTQLATLLLRGGVGSMHGDIDSEFALEVSGKIRKNKISGTLGAGGKELAMTTLNGSIELRKAR